MKSIIYTIHILKNHTLFQKTLYSSIWYCFHNIEADIISLTSFALHRIVWHLEIPEILAEAKSLWWLAYIRPGRHVSVLPIPHVHFLSILQEGHFFVAVRSRTVSPVIFGNNLAVRAQTFSNISSRNKFFVYPSFKLHSSVLFWANIQENDRGSG